MANNLSDRRVVVTGMGVVTPLGHDLDTFWSNLVAGALRHRKNRRVRRFGL